MKANTIIAGIAMLLACTSMNAQDIRVGISAGPVLSDMFSKVDGEKEKLDPKIGFAAGLLVNMAISDNISIQPGLHFVQKGGKEKEEEESVTLSLNYIEVPVNFIYNFGEPGSSFFIGAGPSFGVGISGKLKYKSGDYTASTKVKFGSNEDEDDFKRMDIGANILAGYNISKNLFISAQYNHGFSNLFTGGNSDGKLNNRYWSVKVGWLFGN
ncbi:MAG: PorT family protein [Chitinophagaceae bacterium]|nr:PorT family protein [Chitinophagaceae bacterium]